MSSWYQIKKKIIIAGDLNARVGSDNTLWKDVMGRHGVGKENGNGHLLLEFCTEMNLKIVNTLPYLKTKFKTTWKHPRSKEWHVLDYFIIKARNAKDVLRCRVMRGADCDTDHRMLRCEIKRNVKKFHKTRTAVQKFNLEPLNNVQDRSMFEASLNLKNSYELKEDLEKHCDNIKTSFINAANSTLSNKKERRRDWFDENSEQINSILQIKKAALEKSLSLPTKENQNAYRNVRSECQKVLREVKEKWWCNKTK